MTRYAYFDIFIGSGPGTKIAKELGVTCYSLDNDPNTHPTFLMDVRHWTKEQSNDLIAKHPGVKWILCLCPDCRHFSPANTRNRNLSEGRSIVRAGLRILHHFMSILAFAIVENPKGKLREQTMMKILEEEKVLTRYTVSYCKYSKTLPFPRKNTDIWITTALRNFVPRVCKNDCPHRHMNEKGNMVHNIIVKKMRPEDRAIIPSGLFKSIWRAYFQQVKNS